MSKRRGARFGWLPVLALALSGLALGCGARGTPLELEPQTPLRELRVGVLAHPEKAAEPETDENVLFAEYVAGLEEEAPFASVELVRDPRASSAEVFLSLNLDVNVVKQTSRAAYLPKLLTLWLYNLFGFPNSIMSAHYHLSAVLYDRDQNILNAFYVHEPVTFAWKNIYWGPDAEGIDSVKFAFHRLLATMEREMRHWQSGEAVLGAFAPGLGPRPAETVDSSDSIEIQE